MPADRADGMKEREIVGLAQNQIYDEESAMMFNAEELVGFGLLSTNARLLLRNVRSMRVFESEY
jgi:hypothetical protein